MKPAQARRILKPLGGFFEVARQTTSGHILLKSEGYTADELEAVACLARHNEWIKRVRSMEPAP